MSESLECLEITLRKPALGDEEWIEGLLWEAGASGIERQDDDTFSALVEEPRPRAPGTVRWRVYREAEGGLKADTSRMRIWEESTRGSLETLGLGARTKVCAWRIDDLSFMERWKEHFRPCRVSARLMVHPPWERPQVADDGVQLLCIDPGMAFGTGTHETTRLCLAAVDDWLSVRSGERAWVLDVGTGSGILAIGALLLGAESARGIDNDAVALENARTNAAANQVFPAFDTTPIADVEGTFPLVVANILPHVLLEMSGALKSRTARGGTLVLSGIIETEVERVLAGFVDDEFTCDRILADGEWRALTLVRRAS